MQEARSSLHQPIAVPVRFVPRESRHSTEAELSGLRQERPRIVLALVTRRLLPSPDSSPSRCGRGLLPEGLPFLIGLLGSRMPISNFFSRNAGRYSLEDADVFFIVAGYSFVNPLRSFVIAKLPSARTDILMLWPWSDSLRLARNCSGELCSAPPAAERCNCQKSSSPGASWTICQYSGAPPFLSPLFITATLARIACTSWGAPEWGSPWRVV